jgi:toxin ParE1/3/4
MAYKISRKANQDLDSIWIYTFETWSLTQADRYYELIIDEIKFISENFESGKDYGNIRRDYRCTKVKSHLIFYKRSKNEIIEIIRILHEKMDIENIIKQ